MNLAYPISQEEVVRLCQQLPSFPLIISKILAAVNDTDASLNELVGYIEQDPVIAARVLSLANRAGSRARNQPEIKDLCTAISLIGAGNIREMALVSCITNFADNSLRGQISENFWRHSVAVAVCTQELTRQIDTSRITSESALVAGLLHDIGKLWLFSFHTEIYQEVWLDARQRQVGIEDAEQAAFGVDHAVIGAWISQYWGLPDSISHAIKHHHAPEHHCSDPLVALLHVGEVMTNALDLDGGQENRVTFISAAACEKLGLIWGCAARPDFISLFGRITARARHASTLFS
jgi:putative nucleotidyltransferase with HDIG domain